jgi:hypothetical protein
VDADRLAGTYFLGTSHRSIVSDRYRHSNIAVQEGTHNRSTDPGLEEYIRSKNGWDTCTFGFVNWEVHGKAVTSFEHECTHLTKYLHEALPTYHHAYTMDGRQRKCVARGICDETTDNIFKCSAQSRHGWKETWWRKIERFHEEYSTHPLLRYVFREAMT